MNSRTISQNFLNLKKMRLIKLCEYFIQEKDFEEEKKISGNRLVFGMIIFL